MKIYFFGPFLTNFFGPFSNPNYVSYQNVLSDADYIRTTLVETVNLLKPEHVALMSNTIKLSDRKADILLKLFKKQGLIRTTAKVMDKFKETRKTLAEYYDVSFIKFEVTGGDDEIRPVLYCNDVEKVVGLILEAKLDRNDEPHYLKICVDGGMQTMKVGVQILFNTDRVQRAPLLVAAVDCKENTANFTKIFEICNLLESVKNLQNLHNLKVVFAGDSKVYHLLAGIGNDASTYGCVYCFVKTRTVSITNAAGVDRRVRHSTMVSINSECGETARNYDDAVLGFGTYSKSGKTQKSSVSPEVASQVRMPSIFLKNQKFIDVLRPDPLHLKLTLVRVCESHILYN